MPTWGDHPASGRRRSPRHGSPGRRRTDRARHRAERRRGGACLGIMVASVLSGLLWAGLVLVLVVWC